MTICFSMAIDAHILVEKLIVTTSVLIVGCVSKWLLHGRL